MCFRITSLGAQRVGEQPSRHFLRARIAARECEGLAAAALGLVRIVLCEAQPAAFYPQQGIVRARCATRGRASRRRRRHRHVPTACVPASRVNGWPATGDSRAAGCGGRDGGAPGGRRSRRWRSGRGQGGLDGCGGTRRGPRRGRGAAAQDQGEKPRRRAPSGNDVFEP